MAFYRKTALIEAHHFPFDDSVPQYFKDAVQQTDNGDYCITTLEGDSYFVADCWIARGTHGEFWRIDNQVFKDTYEEVQTTTYGPGTYPLSS